MNIYTCIEFEGHWPVGTAAVVIAQSPVQAARLLEIELEKEGLKQEINVSFVEFLGAAAATQQPLAKILANGNY